MDQYQDTEEYQNLPQLPLPEVDSNYYELEPSSSGSFRQRFLEFIETILVALVLFLVINLITARVVVESVSMQPNLFEGELVVVNKLAFRWSLPERGDIVVFPYPLDPETHYIKRIVGLPGDHVSVQNADIVVNGVLLNEPYIAADPNYSGEWDINDGEVFVLGDNRNNSNDSHNWGSVRITDLVGKAVLIYWPLDHAGVIPHYDLIVTASE